MTYRLKISRSVQIEIAQLPGSVRQRVRRTIASLAFDPRPAGARELADELAGPWRIRLDRYRIIKSIDDDVIVVEIIRVAKRTPRTHGGLVHGEPPQA